MLLFGLVNTFLSVGLMSKNMSFPITFKVSFTDSVIRMFFLVNFED